MVKGKLEFELPEEEREFNIACNASEAFGRLWDIDQELRALDKYGTTIDQKLIIKKDNEGNIIEQPSIYALIEFIREMINSEELMEYYY